jgi:ketosteroid isomerase-like protein
MEALKNNPQDRLLSISWKNRSVDFMKAYQEQDIKKMLDNCSENGTVSFLPLGEDGKGKIQETGKAIWSALIDSFPTIDNTINSVVTENRGVKCDVTIRGKQEKDFGELPSRGKSFEEDHIFIFKIDDDGFIDEISINWNHNNFIKQLTYDKPVTEDLNRTYMGDLSNTERKQQLHDLAKAYVLDGLGAGSFNSIPYHEDVELRAPIHPMGSRQLMIGRNFIKENWWAPLPGLVADTDLLDTYVNDKLTKVTAEFFCHTKEPACTLRIVDRFTVDDDGKITNQENYFDPRDITSPGWRP